MTNHNLIAIPAENEPILPWLRRVCQERPPHIPAIRRELMLRVLWQEHYFTRQQLIARVESMLGYGYFGSDPDATFRCDIAVVRASLAAEGYLLKYEQGDDERGYYIEGRPRMNPLLKKMITGAVAEIDPAQMAVTRRLTPAQQVQKALSMINVAEQAGVYRLCSRQPELGQIEALYLLRMKTLGANSD
ncbi:hypothetical protein KFU94_20490 [Chloroflexi bacterium TSY]|nr:hypothetical protein [Chloroflexi bacterium TSY]